MEINTSRPVNRAVPRQLELNMPRPHSFAFLLILLVAPSGVWAQTQSPFSKWLGAQTNEKAPQFAPVVGKPLDRGKHDKLRRYEISLKIVKGASLKLPSSENAIVTFGERGIQQIESFQSKDDALYLLGTMQLEKHELGWRFYTLNVRVTAGELKGAVVHLRDGKLQKSITDPCIAIYRIPKDVKVEIGEVPFEVVALFAK